MDPLKNVMEMTDTIVLRIHNGENGAMDWVVQSKIVTFAEALEAIRRVVPGRNVHAFEYKDEDGELITVRSEEEMKDMLCWYVSFVEENFENGEFIQPLVIFPRVGRFREKRNIHGLKVQTEANTVSSDDSAMEEGSGSGSKKQDSQDIAEILSLRPIVDTDLFYLDQLGAGCAGTVYKAHHQPTSLLMAVKVIPLDITPENQKQIIAELEILHKCNSPSIIGYYGAFFTENSISMCTEFMDGGSLDKYGKIEPLILGRICASVVSGLHYLWSIRVMHRDVKPSNILLNTQGYIKLCDFGVSVQLVNSYAVTSIGTTAYMAPERISGQEYSVHSDVWSLGVTIFELAVGQFPYEKINVKNVQPFDLLKCIVEQEPPQLPNEEHDKSMISFVSACMQRLPKRRPSPSQLMEHDYVQSFNDRNTELMANWVKNKLTLLNLC